MIINAESLLPHLKAKVRLVTHDASRHLICPQCALRTRLTTLGDGRKKCTVCGMKFRINKVTDEKKILQSAEILLCFCLDFSAHRTAEITHHTYRLVSAFYEHIRRLLTEALLSTEKIKILADHKGDIRTPHDKNRCRWCQSKIRSGEAEDQPPVFGVELKENGEVTLDPLKDDEAVFHFQRFGAAEKVLGRHEGYAGFICCRKFHRFTEDVHTKDKGEQAWIWIRERTRAHHGIWRRNTGYYLKELEWKYNHRFMQPEIQAKKIIDLMPIDFLTTWSPKTRKARG